MQELKELIDHYAALGQISEEERRMLRDRYGYTDGEIDEFEKKNRPGQGQ